MKNNVRMAVLVIFFLTFFFLPQTQSLSSKIKKMRIVSLAPSTTEILFALGLDDEIVGVSQFCNYPPRALTKEKTGTFSQPNVEKILFLKQDIVFCTGLEQAPVAVKLKQLNLKVCISNPANFKELFDSIEEIGRLVNKEKEAASLIEKMRQNIKKINSKVKLIPPEKRPGVLVELWAAPLLTAGKGTFIDELLTLAGGRNIAADTKKTYSYFSPEQVIKRNPGVILTTYMDKENPVAMMEQRFGWENIAAVKNRRIYSDIDPDLLFRPGPRLVDGLKEIYRRLYL